MPRFVKNLIKTIIRLLFPRKQREIIYWLGDHNTMLKSRPNEVNLIYWILRKIPTSKVMVDVGAHFGNTLKRFAEDGWRVYAFEPDPVNRATLEQLCRQWANVSIDTRAVTNEEKTDVPIYHSEVSSGISGMSSFHSSHTEIARVSTVPLDRYCLEKGIDNIDFLKVDTEGHDLFVLQSVPWKRLRPRLIITEFEDRKTVPLGYNYHDLARYLVERGYHVLVSEWFPIVEYGGDHKWRAFARYPTELAGGDKACGNLIAARDLQDFQAIIKVANKYQLISRLKSRSLVCNIRQQH